MANETSIQRARRLAKEKREKEEAAKAAAKRKPEEAKKPETKPGLLAAIRKAFSGDDDIERIEAAVNAVDKGVTEADERKKK